MTDHRWGMLGILCTRNGIESGEKAFVEEGKREIFMFTKDSVGVIESMRFVIRVFALKLK